MEKILYIMRGVPGSGKSTAARILVPQSQIFSTDEFWGPEYNFDIKRLGEAHNWNQQRVKNAMEQGITPIAVDNTNVSSREVKPYVQMAKAHGYEIIFKESVHPIWLRTAEYLKDKITHERDLDDVAKFFAGNTIHKVPQEVIRGMLNRWEVNPQK